MIDMPTLCEKRKVETAGAMVRSKRLTETVPPAAGRVSELKARPESRDRVAGDTQHVAEPGAAEGVPLTLNTPSST